MIRRARGGLPNFSHASMCLGSSSGATKESRRGQRPRPEQEDDGQNGVLADSQHLAYCADVTRNRRRATFGVGRRSFFIQYQTLCFAPSSSTVWRRASRRAARCGQLAYAAQLCRQHDRASPLACSGDFLLRLAVCQGKNLLAKGSARCACRQLVSRSECAGGRVAALEQLPLFPWPAPRGDPQLFR